MPPSTMGMEARTVSFAMEQALSNTSSKLAKAMILVFVIINLYQKLGGQMCPAKHNTAGYGVNPRAGYISGFIGTRGL